MQRMLVVMVMGLSILVGFGTLAPAAEQVIEAVGSSSLSRADALREAQRMAVEQGAGVFIQSETEVENFALKKDKIISRTEGYITRYEVVDEKQSGGEYTVRIRATVSLDKIKDDLIALQILLESMERPKVMVLIDEGYANMDDLAMNIAATEMTALLGQKGFELVDKAQVEAARRIDQGRQALAGNDAAARAVGLKFGAQYVVVGKAVAQDAGEAYQGTGLRSIQASLQLRLIQTQTGLVLGSVVKNAVAAHMSPLSGATQALRQGAQLAVDEYLVDAITDSFQNFLNNGVPLKLHVTGVKSFQTYKQVADDIAGLNRVVSSTKEGWNKAGGLLVLDLRFKGTSEDLAMILDGRTLGKQRFEVIDLAPERLDCQLK
jgi:hypothetical protein